MSKIHKLPRELISQIAAGEVIERPAYAVKELIENAIDAKATSINVEIEDSGLRKIVVSDNGVGMSRSDLLQSFLPHTTSKLSTSFDLQKIKMFGFRGEALSSIAAISDVTISSKNSDSLSGNLIKIHSNKVGDIKKVGMAKGTKVEISNLFLSVPARKKFLKSKRTEYRHILDTVINFALSYSINLKFSRNGQVVFHFTSKDTLEDKIRILFGENIHANILPFKRQDSYLKIYGFLSRPQISFTSSQKINLFVNKRHIYDPLIISAVKDAYSNLLEHGSFPFLVLFLEVPYEIVDVNVHPRKEVVKFIKNEEIIQFVGDTIKSTLEKNNLTFFNISWKRGSTRSFTAQSLREAVSKNEIAQIGKIKSKSDVIQIHNAYLITQTKNGIMFIDQHAAHEAILYRLLKEEFLKRKSQLKTVKLDKGLLLDTTLSDGEIIKQNNDLFNQIGFEIQEFTKNSFTIYSHPSAIAPKIIPGVIQEIVDSLREDKKIKDIDKQSNKMLAFLACRSAIKAGDKLAKKDIKKLIGQLKKNDFVYTCPHGRPVKIEVSLTDLAKIFYRR